MGETRVDLQHLPEDLADAYPGELDETILTEIVANSLDSGATALPSRSIPSRRPSPPSTTAPECGDPISRGPKRPGRLGLTTQYESRPDDAGLGRLVESTVWINDAHPAYRRAVASRAEGYRLALTVAMTLSTIAVEPVQQHTFVTAFLARWGEAVGPGNGRRAARRRS